MLPAGFVSWVFDESGQRIIAEDVARWGYLLRSNKAAPSVATASPSVVVHVLGLNLDTEGDWNLSNVSLSGVSPIRSSLLADFSLIQEKFNEFSINRPLDVGDVF